MREAGLGLVGGGQPSSRGRRAELAGNGLPLLSATRYPVLLLLLQTCSDGRLFSPSALLPPSAVPSVELVNRAAHACTGERVPPALRRPAFCSAELQTFEWRPPWQHRIRPAGLGAPGGAGGAAPARSQGRRCSIAWVPVAQGARCQLCVACLAARAVPRLQSRALVSCPFVSPRPYSSAAPRWRCASQPRR